MMNRNKIDAETTIQSIARASAWTGIGLGATVAGLAGSACLGAQD